MTQPLLQPVTFPNGLEAPNRLWLAPMTNQSSHPDGTISAHELGFLTARAAGGFGTIETCATHVRLEGQGWPGELGIFDDAHIDSWKKLAQSVHQHDALLIGQAFHGGARAMTVEGRSTPWSASAASQGTRVVREGSQEEIEDAIAAFAQAAQRMERAGADGVELHGAHGYLLCQFLSSALNRRADQWGGSLDHRARLLRETMQATRAAVSEDFLVGVRLSPESYKGMPGLDLDESLQVAAWLVEDGADFIHISLWDGARNTQKRPDAHPASLFRDALPPNIPLVAAGGIWSRDDALALLDHGADVAALGRAAIANPAWPHRVARDGEEPKRPPLSPEELTERALGPVFVEYMKGWKGFVSV